VAAGKEHGVLVAEAFKFRHHPMHLKAKELIEAGVIGDLLNVRSTFCTNSGRLLAERTPESNWRFNKAQGGGSIYDLACYNIHHARYVFGEEPVRVFAAQERRMMRRRLRWFFLGGGRRRFRWGLIRLARSMRRFRGIGGCCGWIVCGIMRIGGWRLSSGRWMV
jgi:predicted dehydrogenase